LGIELGDWIGAVVGSLLFLGTARVAINRSNPSSVLARPGVWNLALVVGIAMIVFATTLIALRVASGG
jgi:hypothetical protein